MKIKIISHIRYDGKELQPGTAADMPDEIAKKLIYGGSAEAAQDKSKKEK